MRYISARTKFLKQWTRISEERRKKFFSHFSFVLNRLVDALLMAIPFAVLTSVPYPEMVLSLWIIIPFVEHYYVWLREDWKNKT